MLITLKKLGDRLIPADDDSAKFFNDMKLNQEISFEFKLKRQRSYQYHKLYWAMLKAVMDNQEHYKHINQLHNEIKFKSGLYETIIPLKGEPFIVVGSISFDVMDSLQFEYFMKIAKSVCVEFVTEDGLEEILRFL